MRFHGVLTYMIVAAALSGPAAHGADSKTAGAPFGKTPDGQAVEIFTLRNGHGMEALIMTWGAGLVSLKVADAKGQLDNVVLGNDDLNGYLQRDSFFGKIVGRYGNRIGKARFTLEGKEYLLAANNGANTLHGGKAGFDPKKMENNELSFLDFVIDDDKMNLRKKKWP